ncbi:MAG: ribulose-phosphate 3-epimerase [Anaerolineae bacterium]|nr:ribulose-phosphate 3-epimerase [Anaerolineae bacterium]
MKNIILSPSILSANFSNLQEDVHVLEKSGAHWLHIDVMDGHFVPNITMGPFIVSHCKKITDLPLDVHLMIEKPELHIASFAKAGASWLTIHIESNPNVYRTLQTIRDMGVHPGIAVNPGTPIKHIENVLEVVDMVLVMTVNPGFSGQAHIATMVNKVRQAQQMIATIARPIRIQVDGGISKETLSPILEAGADTIVAASAIFSHPDGISAGVEAIRSCWQ